TAAEIAADITTVTAPVADATSLTLPTVPSGYTITIKSSSNTAVIGINGTITPPATATSVNLVFTITRTSNSATADTGSIAVTVPAHVPTTVTPPSGGSGSSGASTPIAPVTSTNGNITVPKGGMGVVSLNQLVTISIPAGASNEELKISIDAVANTQPLLTNQNKLVSQVFEILKNVSGNFSKPVTMTFAFDPSKLDDSQTVAVFYFDEVKKEWVKVAGGTIKDGKITVEVNHFTKFAVFAVSKEAAPKPVIDFSDISGHWAEAAIKQAVSFGIVGGYPDGTFNPNRTVTRAEFAVMLMNTLKPQADGAELTFTDKGKIATWAQKSVAQAVQAGILTGYKDSTFRPDAEITRSEMAVMIAKALGLSVEAATATGFTDDKDIPYWAKGAVGAMKKLSIIDGKGANTFAPGNKATRAESVTVLLKMLAQKGK
ncbi:S-layer homology domain-containing protein, partial [Cohnella soli]